MQARACARLSCVLGLVALAPFVVGAASSGQAGAPAASSADPSLVGRLQQFIKDNPTSPKLQAVYSSLLAAAAREGDSRTLVATAEEALARFPRLAMSVTGAMTAFRTARGDRSARILAQKLVQTETSPGVLLAAARAFSGNRLQLLQRAIALRRTVDDADGPPTLDNLKVEYADALDQAGRHREAARLLKEVRDRAGTSMASLPALHEFLVKRYEALVRQAVSAGRYERALEHVTAWEASGGESPLEFATTYEAQRAAIYRAMRRPDLELESWVKSFASCLDLTVRDRIGELAVNAAQDAEDLLRRAREMRARAGRPVVPFELKTADGPPLALASITSTNKVTLFTFFFPT